MLNRSPGFITQFALTFLLLVVFTNCNAQAPKQPYIPGLFSAIHKLPADKRVAVARDIAKAKCRQLSEAGAMKSLNDLTSIARSLNDLPLECAVFDMRADYYSVNYKYNKASDKFYDDAIRFAEQNELPLETAIYLHRKGVYYLIYKHNIAACRYFLLAMDKFREIRYDNVPDMDNYFMQVATFYYSIGDFDDARVNLKNALKYQPALSRNRINILNTIGLTYRNSKQYQVSMPYFTNALNMAKAMGDSVWMAITTGNIGSVYFLERRYNKALPLVQADYEESLKYKQTLNAAIALLRLAQISLDTGDLKKAAGQLLVTKELLAKSEANTLKYDADYYNLSAILNDKLGRPAEANNNRKQYGELKDRLDERDNLAEVERVRLHWEIDKNREKFSKLKAYDEVGKLKRNAVIIVLSLLMVIIILIYNRQRLKAKKNAELLASEKRRVDEELKSAAIALNGYTENLMQKNLLIENFKTEVEKLKLQFTNEDGARQLDKMIQAHIMTDENWGDFKALFTRVHPAFFYQLRNKLPNLTGTDIRLLALIKLKLNNREMAGMLGITIDGIKKAKQRLRKKIALQPGVELEDVVDNI
jgi:tetratricopeptide (TPR) repeat protein